MPGNYHNPLQDINLIKDNLRDRYKDDFSILKEILQNTDDAGARNHRNISFEFGLSPGIPELEHQLFKGPALFFFNDGDFKEEDEESIFTFGLSNKAKNENTIGKFGLGMKSVFHFCEAYFFLAKNQEQSFFNIHNPWIGDSISKYKKNFRHLDWEQLPKNGQERVESHLKKIIEPYQSQLWFLLWLPLRKKEHSKEVGSICEKFPGDDISCIRFLDDFETPKQLAKLLPLLRRIIKIQFWEFNCKKNNFELSYKISMNSSNSRIQFNREKNSPSSYNGEIQCENLLQSKKISLFYTGQENNFDLETLKTLKNNSIWPKNSAESDDENDQNTQIPDKNEQHSSVVFSCLEEPTDKATLNIKWAVFLPIETGEEKIPCLGKKSYSITLHGYFFVDAGRAQASGIYPSEPKEGKKLPTNEQEIRYQWNRCLAQEGTLPLLIPALDEFVKNTKLDTAEINHLCQALNYSEMMRKNGSAICSEYQYIFQLKPDKPAWTKVQKDTPLLPLPR